MGGGDGGGGGGNDDRSITPLPSFLLHSLTAFSFSSDDHSTPTYTHPCTWYNSIHYRLPAPVFQYQSQHQSFQGIKSPVCKQYHYVVFFPLVLSCLSPRAGLLLPPLASSPNLSSSSPVRLPRVLSLCRVFLHGRFSLSEPGWRRVQPNQSRAGQCHPSVTVSPSTTSAWVRNGATHASSSPSLMLPSNEISSVVVHLNATRPQNPLPPVTLFDHPSAFWICRPPPPLSSFPLPLPSKKR